VVKGDLILLSAGDVITGDSRLLESKDHFVDKACLTGKTFPVEKGAFSSYLRTKKPNINQ